MIASWIAVPSISRSQPEFYSKDMWRGPVWININYLIARGLERYGFREEAGAWIFVKLSVAETAK